MSKECKRDVERGRLCVGWWSALHGRWTDLLEGVAANRHEDRLAHIELRHQMPLRALCRTERVVTQQRAPLAHQRLLVYAHVLHSHTNRGDADVDS